MKKRIETVPLLQFLFITSAKKITEETTSGISEMLR